MAGDETGQPGAPVVIESLLLAVAHHWSRRETEARQIELLERHFSQDQLKDAIQKLHDGVGNIVEGPKNRQGNVSKTATRKQAEDLTGAFNKLGNKDKLPRFVVQSDDLTRVIPLLGALSVGDERSVSARLEALELSQKQNMIEMRKMMAMGGTNSATSLQPTIPNITVSPPSFSAGVGSSPRNAGLGNAPSSQPGLHPSKASYAETVGRTSGANKAGGSAKQQGQVQRRARIEQVGWSSTRSNSDRSTSSKRRRLSDGEDPGGDWLSQDCPSSSNPWLAQGRPRKMKSKPKVNTGSATSEGLMDLAGPATFWIGNTRADTDESMMSEILHKAAENIEIPDFKVEEVVCLTKESHPRTRSWKVTVPARLSENMMQPEMYPAGWTFRPFTKWHNGPNKRPESGAKRPTVAPGDQVAPGAKVAPGAPGSQVASGAPGVLAPGVESLKV